MKLKNRNRLTFGYLIISLFFLLTDSCSQVREIPSSNPVNPMAETEYYFLGRTENQISIRMFKSTAKNDGVILASPVYSMPIWYPASVLPPVEQAILSNCNIEEQNCILPNVLVEHRIGNLSISFNKKSLAWQDSFSYCPNADCVGQSQVLLWKLDKNEEQVFLVTPYHIGDIVHQQISDLSWSPSDKFVAYIHSSKEMGWSRLMAVDIQTSQITNVGEDVYKYLWSYDGKQIGYIGWEYDNSDRQGFLKIVTLETTKTDTYYNDWIDMQSMTWSPDQKQIAVLALKKDKAPGLFVVETIDKSIHDETALAKDNGFTIVRWSPKESKIVLSGNQNNTIRILDMVSRNSLDAQTSSNYVFGWNTSWSPDGRVVGVNTYSTNDKTISNGIAFINAKTGSIISWLNLEGVSEDWIWSQTGSEIILNLQNKQVTCPNSEKHGIGVFNWQDNTLKVVSFDAQTMNAIANCELIIDEIIQ